MVLGCVLCRKPLVTYSSSQKEKKKQYLRGKARGVSDKIQNGIGGGGGHDSLMNQIGESQTPLTLSRCGHLFHKQCLKIFISTQQSAGGGMRRECPICFKPVTLTHSIPVTLNVDSSDLLVEKLNGLLRDNDRLHERVRGWKKELGKKTQDLKELAEDLNKSRQSIDRQTDEINQIIQPPQNFLEKSNQTIAVNEKFFASLTEQNSTLISLIENEAGKRQNPKTRYPREVDSLDQFFVQTSKKHGLVAGNSLSNTTPREAFVFDARQENSLKNGVPPPRKVKECDAEEEVKRRPTPKGLKYLEYKERQSAREYDLNDFEDDEDEYEDYIDLDHTTINSKKKSACPETIRKVVEQARRKRLVSQDI